MFKELNKISLSTAILAVLTILISYLATLMGDSIKSVQLGQIAIILLVLFFYSLLKDKISELEKNAPAE